MIVMYKIPITWNVLYFIPIILVLFLFTFGCASFLMHFGVYVADLTNVMNIVLKFLFYLTGIFYNIETKLDELGPLLAKANPVAFLITSTRNCLIYESTPARKLLLLWLVISLLISAFGVAKIYRNENSYVKMI